MYLVVFFRLVVPESALDAKNSCAGEKTQSSGSNSIKRYSMALL